MMSARNERIRFFYPLSRLKDGRYLVFRLRDVVTIGRLRASEASEGDFFCVGAKREGFVLGDYLPDLRDFGLLRGSYGL